MMSPSRGIDNMKSMLSSKKKSDFYDSFDETNVIDNDHLVTAYFYKRKNIF